MNFLKSMVTVLVRKNYGVCFDFYTEKLGLLPIAGDRNGPWTGFAMKKGDEYCLALFAADSQSAYKGYIQPIATAQTDTSILGIPTDNFDEDYNRLREAGVEFIGEPQAIKEWGLRTVRFRDPEGNLLSLNSRI